MECIVDQWNEIVPFITENTRENREARQIKKICQMKVTKITAA